MVYVVLMYVLFRYFWLEAELGVLYSVNTEIMFIKNDSKINIGILFRGIRMGSGSSIDIMTFTLNVLKEHEKNLDEISNRFDNLFGELSKNNDLVKNNFITVNTVVNLLQYKAFENPYFSFGVNPINDKEYILLDKRNNYNLLVNTSKYNSDSRFWSIHVYNNNDENCEEELETHNFNSETNMIAWLIAYMLKD